jgi:hypothetical protein
MACCGSNSDSDWEEKLEEGVAAFLFLDLGKKRKCVLGT